MDKTRGIRVVLALRDTDKARTHGTLMVPHPPDSFFETKSAMLLLIPVAVQHVCQLNELVLVCTRGWEQAAGMEKRVHL